MSKVIIVEGKTDRERLLQILDEPVEIICSFGTLDPDRLEQWILDYREDDIYVLVDADDAGGKLRKQINREIDNVHPLYTRKMYREVATTPLEYLSQVLLKAHFKVKDTETLSDIEKT